MNIAVDAQSRGFWSQAYQRVAIRADIDGVHPTGKVPEAVVVSRGLAVTPIDDLARVAPAAAHADLVLFDPETHFEGYKQPVGMDRESCIDLHCELTRWSDSWLCNRK